MTPRSLTITNFGPFVGRQVFTFPSEPGLYFLWGENREEPRLEANGAGKTKLWEALVWCIFGKTSRGLKAGDAANWEAGKGTSVEFVFEVEEPAWMQYTCRRTWGPISWTLTNGFGDEFDLAKDSNPLLAALRLEMTAFLNCVLMAQGEPMFLDLKAEAKASLFAEVMQLDRWIEHAKKASRMAGDQDLVSRRLERELAGVEAQLEQLEGAPLDKLFDDWAEGRARRRQGIEQEYARLIEDDDRLAAEIAQAQKLEDEAREALKEAVKGSDARRVAVKDKKQLVDECLRSADRLKDRVGRALDDLKFWREHDRCPTCGHEPSDEEVSAHRHDHEAEAEKLERELKAATANLRQAEQALRSAQEAQEGAYLAADRALRRVDDLSARKRDLQRQREALGKRLDELEDQDEAVAAEVNPYAALLDQQDESRQELRRGRSRLQRQLDDSDSQYRLLQNWARWFKEIRLNLIGQALTELEIEVNSCVNALGLIGWELRFEVDRETKSGGMQRGFNVAVRSPHNTKPVPWEAWSGGEGQRLRVAAQEGLANLIRSRTGCPLNLEVWDEPTQWMSGQGVTDLLESLRARASAEGRQIWIVDHRSLHYGGFTGSAGVIKEKQGGSRFDLTGLYISQHEQPASAASDPPHDVRRPRTRTRRASQPTQEKDAP